MRSVFLSLLGASFLVACGTPLPEMSRDEMLAKTVRVYEGKTKYEVRDAAESVLRLALGEEGNVTVREDEVTALHSYVVFILINAIDTRWYWQVRVQDDPRGGKAIVRLTSGGELAIGGGGGQADFTYPEPYDLFWARMDYLLGVSRHWPTCVEQKTTIGALCFFAPDRLPSTQRQVPSP